MQNADLILNKDSIMFEKLNFSECMKHCNIRSRIINQSLVDNKCKMTIGAHLNCAGNFESKINLRSDTIFLEIHLKPEKDGSIISATCNCFFQIGIGINGIKKMPKEILINGLTLDENFESESDIFFENPNDSMI